jgi:heme ABC exporter ATP-binding subunit CcmA
VITATELRLSLAGRPILDGVSFTVARGESVALVGPNGSGKTSILRCLLGLVPFTGTVTIDGHDAGREPVAARSHVSYVPQRPAYGDASAAEVLAFVAKVRRIDPTRIGATLAEVGLAAHARRPVRTLSGGMQQRLSLAVALLSRTPILLLDEPSASLDREGQESFFAIVARLRARGDTLLLASHRPEEVERLTDRVLHLDDGRLVTPAAPVVHGRVIPLVARGDCR